nr:MAG TPA: hypothetical protein [Bacteriophage sp.]
MNHSLPYLHEKPPISFTPVGGSFFVSVGFAQ